MRSSQTNDSDPLSDTLPTNGIASQALSHNITPAIGNDRGCKGPQKLRLL